VITLASDLSNKQLIILNFLKQETMSKGYPPSVREICEAVGLKSTSTVHGHLERLEKKGLIRRDPTKPRAIEIVDDDFQLARREMVNVPILGKVAAGSPILAQENIEDYFPIPVNYAPNTNAFMLRVKGDSMINVGIYENDLILIQQQQTARNGDIVVALIEDSATVKTFFKESNHIRLQPENDNMEPIIVNEVSILGKVVGLYRTLS
jgi:repressor LexA